MRREVMINVVSGVVFAALATIGSWAWINVNKLWDRAAILLESQPIPTTAVIAFNAKVCPVGWSEYEPAYGRFIRGIDPDGNTDPEGKRLPGQMQTDTFGEHSHTGVYSVHAPQGTGGPTHGALEIRHTEGRHDSATASLALDGGPETRPKNVALLYCEKL